MSPAAKRSASFLCMAVLFFCTCLPAALRAEDALPEPVRAQSHAPLAEVGSGTYRRFGFSVYRATLWAPNGVWDAAKPYALELHYTRSVDKETMVDIVSGDIRDENVADDDTLARWEKILNATLPDVEDGDKLIGISLPGKESQLFYNEKKIAGIGDQAFSRAFFNIWLGETADEKLRNELLGRAQ
jgi:hypothetical protein